MEAKYDGNVLLGVDFSLYGLDDIDYDATVERILELVSGYEDKIKRRLESIGVKYIGAEWYIPTNYNYENDGITITLELKDSERYIEYLIKNKNAIQKLLDKNQSYDGYIALTVDTVEDEIAKTDGSHEPDILCVSYKLQGIIPQDAVYDCYVFPEENE